MSIILDPGTQCVANGRVVEIDGPESITTMRVRDVLTGNLTSVPTSSLSALPSNSKVTGHLNVSNEDWQRSTALAKELEKIRSLRRVPRKTLEVIAKRLAVSVRTLQRAKRRYDANPRPSSLLQGRPGCPKDVSRLEPKVDRLVSGVIEKHYFRRERPSKEEIVLRCRSLARRLGFTQPNRKSVLLRIKRAEGWRADVKRYGSKHANQKWKPTPGQLYVENPLDVLQIDHTRGDIILLNDERTDVIGRPWVTFAIDVATRCVMGMYISMDTPSSVSLSLCIEHAVLPKAEDRASPGLWPMYGKPKTILVDNGSDFRAMALIRGCQEHGIDLTWRPVKEPRFGGHVERLIGTLMQMVHLLPGTTFSNPKERGDYDSKGKASMTLSEYRAWMTETIGRKLHARRHSALGVPPLVAWERAHRTPEGVIRPPALVSNPVEFRLDFLPFELRPVRRVGITLANSRYWHDDLRPLLGKGDVEVRYDPRDWSTVWVRRPDGLLVTAPAVAGRASPRHYGQAPMTPDEQARMDALVDQAYERTDAIVEAAAQKKRAARSSKDRRSSNARKRKPEAVAASTPSLEFQVAPAKSVIDIPVEILH